MSRIPRPTAHVVRRPPTEPPAPVGTSPTTSRAANPLAGATARTITSDSTAAIMRAVHGVATALPGRHDVTRRWRDLVQMIAFRDPALHVDDVAEAAINAVPVLVDVIDRQLDVYLAAVSAEIDKERERYVASTRHVCTLEERVRALEVQIVHEREQATRATAQERAARFSAEHALETERAARLREEAETPEHAQHRRASTRANTLSGGVPVAATTRAPTVPSMPSIPLVPFPPILPGGTRKA
jgi:hypothetical protein